LPANEGARGRILQINISLGGVPKTPVAQAEVGPMGIVGDGHRFRLHGGADKALLILAAEVVDALRAAGWPVYYGALGENLTTLGLDQRAWQSGQRFRCGSVLIELTSPREPCRTLNPYGRGIQKRLREKPGESGFYAAVLTGGALASNAIIEGVERIS
jgi:MOSC domain-containing protein YiiM